jgi:hypothetical protein
MPLARASAFVGTASLARFAPPCRTTARYGPEGSLLDSDVAWRPGGPEIWIDIQLDRVGRVGIEPTTRG